jgi:hypothetical protein
MYTSVDFCDQIRPDVNMEQISNLDARPFNAKPTNSASSQHMVSNEHSISTSRDEAIPSNTITPGEEDATFESVTYLMRKVRIGSDQRSFFGKSSQFMLTQSALSLKNERLGQSPDSHTMSHTKRPEFWTTPPVSFSIFSKNLMVLPNFFLSQWEQQTSEQQFYSNYVFPDQDLMADLINIFFIEINCHMPLLHRPTFQRDFDEGLHKRDDAFGAVVLLVCAVASRFSDDPRVFITEASCNRSCGWKWFNQLRVMRTNLLAPPSLYDVQRCCVSFAITI